MLVTNDFQIILKGLSNLCPTVLETISGSILFFGLMIVGVIIPQNYHDYCYKSGFTHLLLEIPPLHKTVCFKDVKYSKKGNSFHIHFLLHKTFP